MERFMIEANVVGALADLPGDRVAMLVHNLETAWYDASDARSVLREVRLRYLRVAHLTGPTDLDIAVATRVLGFLQDHEDVALAAIEAYRPAQSHVELHDA
jgi:hypothetical protein